VVSAIRVARALVLEAPGRLVERELAIPDIGDDDGVLRVEACGLCGTDHELYTGDLPWPSGFVPGHETVGVVEAVGDRAGERWGVEPGDRVTVAPRPACRDCEPCRRGELAACTGYTGKEAYGLISVDQAPGLWGGYATHHYLGSGRCCTSCRPTSTRSTPPCSTRWRRRERGRRDARHGARRRRGGPGTVSRCRLDARSGPRRWRQLSARRG
jgi:hypothetical protein